jgi:hypothetical protein
MSSSEILHSMACPAVDAFARDVEAKLAVRVNFRVLVARRAHPRVYVSRRSVKVALGVFCARGWGGLRESYDFSGHGRLLKNKIYPPGVWFGKSDGGFSKLTKWVGFGQGYLFVEITKYRGWPESQLTFRGSPLAPPRRVYRYVDPHPLPKCLKCLGFYKAVDIYNP